MFVLGTDLGTSGTKTVLFDKTGKVISSDTVEYPLYQLENGWAEQDASDWWEAVVLIVNNVINKSGI